MISPKTAAIENVFPDDVEEIIERVLLRYRPILSHVVMGSLRSHLQRAIQSSLDLRPWLPVGFRPVHGTGALTAGQVALLGGTRPMRVLHSVAYDLSLGLDGGDKKSLHAAEQVLFHSSEALASLVDHHVVVPVKGLDARLRRLRGFVRVGVAAQIAALMGGLYEHHLWAGPRELEERPEELSKKAARWTCRRGSGGEPCARTRSWRAKLTDRRSPGRPSTPASFCRAALQKWGGWKYFAPAAC